MVLKSEVTSFVNQIAEIIHTQTNRYGGALGSQNKLGTYLLIWKLDRADLELAQMMNP